MDRDTKKYLTKVHEGYVRRRAKEDWRITAEDWLAFWEDHPLLESKIKKPRETVIVRHDETAPWTIENLGVMTRKKMFKRVAERRRRQRVEIPANPTLRVLSLKQWLEEIRR